MDGPARTHDRSFQFPPSATAICNCSCLVHCPGATSVSPAALTPEVQERRPSLTLPQHSNSILANTPPGLHYGTSRAGTPDFATPPSRGASVNPTIYPSSTHVTTWPPLGWVVDASPHQTQLIHSSPSDALADFTSDAYGPIVTADYNDPTLGYQINTPNVVPSNVPILHTPTPHVRTGPTRRLGVQQGPAGSFSHRIQKPRKMDINNYRRVRRIGACDACRRKHITCHHNRHSSPRPPPSQADADDENEDDIFDDDDEL